MSHQTITDRINDKGDDRNQLDSLTLPAVQRSSPNYVLPSSSIPIFQTKRTLPAFLNKLHAMVDSPDTDPWVHWSDNGDTFIIPNSQTLAEQVLGRHFKHNNFASFVRQLNMYGFHKVPHLNHGVLHNDGLPEVWEFTNDDFHRDNPGRMFSIVRKKGEAEKARANAKHQVSVSPPPESIPQPSLRDPDDIAIARAEIHAVANRQKVIREEIMRSAGNTENLWKYALETRRRHQEQQAKLERLITFLSEAFRKRVFNTELPTKVRGLLEGPLIEELSDRPSPSSFPPPVNPEQGQLDLMKVISNGKCPVGFQGAMPYINNHSTNNAFHQTPLSTTSPNQANLSDAVTTYQAANNDNTQHLEQVQEWINRTDHTLQGLGIDLGDHNTTTGNNGNVNYADYLNDSNLNLDTFVPAANPDPAMDLFTSAGDASLDSLQPWLLQFLNSDHEVSNVGQKRTLRDEEECLATKKRKV